MKVGYLFLIAGTIVASLGAAKLPEADHVLAGVGLALLVASVAILRRATGTAGPNALSGSVTPTSTAPALLQGLLPRLEALSVEAKDLPLVTITRRLDELEPEFLAPLADSSPALMEALGPERFAEVAGTYASGERFLARAWSAAADKHRPEAIASLNAAVERMREALAMLGERS